MAGLTVTFVIVGPFVKYSLVPIIPTIKKWVGESVGRKNFSVGTKKSERAEFSLKKGDKRVFERP